MKKNRLLALTLLAALTLSLTACGGGGGSSSSGGGSGSSGASSSMPDQSSTSAMAPSGSQSEEEDPPAPALPYVNPLTGEGSAEDLSARRPIAVMLNNLKKALPQAGVSQADIIYEMPAEGGITRMMGVFQSVEGVGEIGTVRSARDYYASVAYGLDAVFLHAGGSPQAYDFIQDNNMSALDCVNGPYEGTLFWRDAQRRKDAGLEHSVLTSGEKITQLLPTYKRLRLTHEDGYTYPQQFMAEGETATGRPAGKLEVKFSSYKTGVFTYDGQSGEYLVEEYGAPYVDANNGLQVSVKNVLVLFTNVRDVEGDTKGRKEVDVVGSGSGLFLCDGAEQDITWKRTGIDQPLCYYDQQGNPLKLGVGSSYVNILGKGAKVTTME